MEDIFTLLRLQKGQWILSPYMLIKDLTNPGFSPLGMIPPPWYT
jgi:hypothetical protein